jgi:hypothetical protein
MADDTSKPKTADGDDPGVLSSLPSTRPQRLSRRGREGTATTPRKAGPGAAKRPAKAKAAGSKAKASGPTAASRRKAAAGTTAKATATKAESAAAAARPARAKRAAKTEPAPIPLATSGKPRPTPVRPGHPTLEDSSGARPPGPADDGGQSGVDLVKTVLQAAGEVAQIGATVGGQILRRAVDKLPGKP